MNSVSYISNTGAVTDFTFNKRTNRFEPVLYGVRFLSYFGRSLLLTAPNRFYSRKHAQQWARDFKRTSPAAGLIRFQTFERA